MAEGGERTILLVEDESLIALGEKRSLEGYGYRVIVANTGEKAVGLFEEGVPIDLVLMDINLGKGMDGTESARLILKAEDVPIVFLSSHSEPEVVERTEKVTSYGYILKNSSVTVLDAAIKMAFRLFDSNRRLRETEIRLEAMIREQKETENSLTLKNEMFQKVLDSIPQFICWKNTKSEFLGCNRNFAAMAGLPDTQSIVGKSDWDMPWKTQETEHFILDDAQVMDADAPKFHIIESALDGKGRETWLDTNKVPLHDVQGRVGGILVAFSDITERWQAEKLLMENEFLYETVLKASPDGISITDLDGRILMVSQSVVKMFGIAEDELIGRTITDFIEDRDRGRALSNIGLMFQGTMTGPGEYGGLRKDGDIVAIEVNAEIIRDAELRPSRIVFIIRDISRRKSDEETLARETFLLKALMDNSSDHFYFKDRQGRFIRNSASQARFLGVAEPAEMLGRTDFDFFSAEHAELAREDEVAIMRTGRKVTKEETNLLAGGPEVCLLIEKMPLRDNEGNIVGTFGISKDITERKLAQRALAREQYLLRALMDTTPDYIYFKDRESRFLRASLSLVRQFGFEDESRVVGKTDYDFFPREQARRKREDEQDIMRTGRMLKEEEKETGIDLPDTWVYSIKLPLKDIDGEIVGTFGISRDVTEMKGKEERIERLLEEKEVLLKEVHHRVKNNMNTIGGLLALQAAALKEPQAAHALEEAGGRIQSMLVLYEKLYRSPDFDTVSVREYLPSLVDQIIGNFPNADTIRIEERIDDFTLGTRVLQPLGIIINELLTNIMKYAFIGRSGGAIEIFASDEGGRARLAIQDDGVTMPEGIDFGSSPGFGLMLVGLLTQQLNGDIRIERGGGTRIVLEFEK